MAETAMQRLSLSEGHSVREPNNNDVLCGRGGSINSHPGNEHFREMVEKYRKVYLNARFKQEKRLIATTIVTDIRALDPPGRFLAKDATSGTWRDIGDEKARDKTSQALRENAPKIRAGIKGEKQPRTKTKRKPKAIAPNYPPAVHSSYPMQQPWGGGYNGYYGHVPPPGAATSHSPSTLPVNGTYQAGQYVTPHPSQYQQPPAGPAASNMVWPNQPVAPNQGSQPVLTMPDSTPSSHQQGQNPHGGFTPPAALHTLGAAYNETQQQNGGNGLQYYSPTNQKTARNGTAQHARSPPNQPRESRNEEPQGMEIEQESVQSSSLLHMVANHILGAWDNDAICGVDAEVIASERPKKIHQNGFHHSMPPPKERKKDDVAWSFNQWNSEPAGSNLSLGGSFDSNVLTPAVSMDVDATTPICPKEWRPTGEETDNVSLGTLSSGLVSMNENVLNQVPSWEGSFHSMSTTSIRHKDSSVAALPRPDSTRSGTEISYAISPSRDYEDTRLAIALQQQENVAAYEEFKKKFESTSKASTNRTARSGALDHIKHVRNKELGMSAASGHANGAHGYDPPDAVSQEDADHKLAIELQKFEQSRAGTVQQMEKILKQERQINEKPTQRTGRSVFWSKYT